MDDPGSRVRAALGRLPVEAQVIQCDPELADTAVFCKHYGYAVEDSVNTILVSAKTGQKRTVACVLLADSRLDVNRVVRKRLGSRRVSFASADTTRELTGMELGGVTPVALPGDMLLWVDGRVMEREIIVLGGGDRNTKIITSPAVFKHTPNTEVVAGLAMPITDQE